MQRAGADGPVEPKTRRRACRLDRGRPPGIGVAATRTLALSRLEGIEAQTSLSSSPLSTPHTSSDVWRLSDLPLSVSVATRICCFSALGIMGQVYLSQLGGSQLQISLSTSLAWGAIMLFSRFWGALSDALAMRRGTILVAATGSTLMSLMLVRSASVSAVLMGVFLVEAFGAGLPPAAMALLSERGAAASRGKRISLFTTSQSIGVLAGSLLGGLLASTLPFPGAFGVITAVSAGTVVAALLIPRRDGVTGIRMENWRAAARKILPSFEVVAQSKSLREYGLLYAYGGVVLRKAGVIGIMGLVIVYLDERLALTPLTSGALFAINPAAQALFMPVWGRAADRFRRRPIFLSGYLLTLLMPVMILLADSTWLLVGSFLVLGVGFSGFITGITAYIGDIAPGDEQGELMGLLSVSQGAGGILGPLVAGVVSSPFVLGYDGMFVSMFLMMLVGLILTVIGTRDSGPAR
ncbi:MAG: MFS transporter [Chloroflexota bacterium]